MSFIKQISKAIKKQRSCRKQDRIATHFLLVFGFALVGLSFLLYGAIGGQLARAQTVGWYSEGGTWGFRQKITISPSKVIGNLTNFQVLVQIADESNPLFGKALSNGQDILFTASDGITKLSHEIAEYSEVSGSKYLQAWVKIPTLVGFSIPATSFYMYYANPVSIDQQDSNATWSEYHLIQHMHDSGTVFEDKSPAGNDGVPSNVIQGVEGKIGKAASFNGTNSLINVGSSNNLTGDNLQTVTMSAWVKFDSTASQYPFAVKRSAAESSLISLNVNAGVVGKVGFVTKPAGAESVPHSFLMSPISGYNNGNWCKLEAVVSGLDRILYVNGTSIATDVAGLQSVIGNTANAMIGAFNATQLQFDGQIDEVRFYRNARSSNWIATSYNNENDPSAFVSFGLEEIHQEPPPITIIINAPISTSEWKIGDTENIDWIVSGNPLPDHYSLSYQEVSAGSWTPIADNVLYPNHPWNIPAVDNPGNNFKVKIEVYDTTENIIITVESDAFEIDYGPVADWNLEATIDGYPLRPAEGMIDTSKLSLDTSFTLKATAEDVHGNTIINQSDPVDFGITIIGGGALAISIIPNSLGGSGSSVWDQGTASFDNYRFNLFSPQPGDTFPAVLNLTTSIPSKSIKIRLFKYGIFVFEPESTSDWAIGENEDIIFKFGGLTPTNPNNSFARFYYSQTGDWTTPYPVKDENGNDRKVAYQAGQQLINVPWLLPSTLDINQPVEVKAEFYDDNGTPADPSDDEILASDISDSFSIGGVVALEGTYVSAKFDISDTPSVDTFLNFSDVNGFVATYGEDIGGHSDVEFSLSFLNGSDQLLGTAIHPDGWFVLDDLNFDASMAVLNNYNWLSQIKQIQFRIKLQTDDYSTYSPYVEYLELSFEIDTSTQVGTINFETSSTQSIARGSSAEFGVRMAITGGYESQIGEIVLRGEADDATITADPVIITGTGATIYTANVSFGTTNLTTLGNHAISISAEITGNPEMTFTPSLLTGTLTVTDATAENFSIVWVAEGDTDKTVQPGGIASYNFIVEWDDNYTYDINLTTTAPTVVGTSHIKEIEFLVDGIASTRAVKPLISPYIAAIEMQITTKLNGGEKTLTAFDITGEGNLIEKNISPMPSLTISNQPADVVIIDAKAEVEGGTAASFTSPTFTVRLYKKGATSTYTEQTGVLAVSKDATTGKYLVKASFDKATTDTAGKVVMGTTYIGYLRSIRHLWKKATTPTSGEITISAGTNSYTLEFPKLIAGDIYPDNEINSFDFGAALTNFGQTLSNALNDFDNNGQINAIDLGFVLINYFKNGDLLP